MEAIIEPQTGELTTVDSWDVICEAGRVAQQNMDEARWIIGDLACLVDKEYGKDKIADFAREVNVEKARVREYRTVAKFYKNLPRQKFFERYPNLTYSHLRDAMRFGDAALPFLHEAAANTWTVEQARIELAKRLGKPVAPKPILDAAPCAISGAVGQFEITFRFHDTETVRLLRDLFWRKTGDGLAMTLVRA